MTLHRFSESLARSASYTDAAWWADVYRSAFPSLASCVSVREDGWAQRGGIDRVLTLKCGRVIRVDEKVREKAWPDFLLERWSDTKARKPGWVQKPLACDFIAYAFAASGECFLFPTLTLQRAWRENGRAWADSYGERVARNPHYVTTSVPVPRAVLLDAIRDTMLIRFVPSNLEAA